MTFAFTTTSARYSALLSALCFCFGVTFFQLPAQARELPKTLLKPTTALAFVGAKVLLTEQAHLNAELQPATVLVKDGYIVELLAASQTIPAHYQQVDVSGQYLLPGLIDAHVHLAQSGSAFTRPDMIEATAIQPYTDDQQWLHDHLPELLSTYLSLGVTTVVDMGGPAARLRRYASLSQQTGLPEIVAAAALLSPTSVPQLTAADGNTFQEITSPKSASEAVRQQIRQGAAIVKIVWSQETGLSDAQLTTLYQDAINTAKAAGKIVAVHVESLTSAKQAMRAGVDILVHGVVSENIDAEFITLARQHQVSYLPTLTAYQHYADIFSGKLSFTEFEHQLSHHPLIQSFTTLNANPAKTGELYQIFRRYMRYVDAPAAKLAELSADEQSIVAQLGQVFSVNIAKIQQQNLQLALQSGLNVAFGTDAGNPGTLHATSIREEMRTWQQAGVSNAAILRAMTLGNAVALKLDHKQGHISAGQQATFILLQHNPLQENFQFSPPLMVVQRGHIVKL
jgi:imidazolonepropionase-like amidohydrolase